jgi:hypothetical protein
MIKNKDVNAKTKLDRAGRRIVKESGLSLAEIEAIGSSPFLYSRVRAHIADELERQEASGFWSNLGTAANRAIPAMSLAAAFSFGLLFYVNENKSSSPSFSVDAYLGAGDSGIDNMLFAERRPLTADEVLTNIVSRDERRQPDER